MYKYFYYTDKNGTVKRLPFNRFHLSEATGDRVLTVNELANEDVALEEWQARQLLETWNRDTDLFEGREPYSL